MPCPHPPALDWSLGSSSLPVKLNLGVLPRGTGRLCSFGHVPGHPSSPAHVWRWPAFSPSGWGGHLKTPLMCLETVSENAGHFSVCPHVAGSPFVGAVTSPRPFQSVFCPWWLQWPYPHPLQGSRVVLAAPCSPEAWRSLLGCDSRRRPGPSRALLPGSGLEKLSQMPAQAEAPPRRPRVLCWLFIQEPSFGCIL